MNKIVRINERKFLGAYIAAQRGGTSGDLPFFAGVLLTMVLPQMFYSIYGGTIPSIALLGNFLVGSIIGVVKFRYGHQQVISCVGKRTRPSDPLDEIAIERAA